MNDFRMDNAPHSIIMENRERCSISGVIEVMSFDEDEIVMETNRGMLTIGGSNLHVEKLSLDIGELVLDGTIDAMVYADEKRTGKSFWGRFF